MATRNCETSKKNLAPFSMILFSFSVKPLVSVLHPCASSYTPRSRWSFSPPSFPSGPPVLQIYRTFLAPLLTVHHLGRKRKNFSLLPLVPLQHWGKQTDLQCLPQSHPLLPQSCCPESRGSPATVVLLPLVSLSCSHLSL
uniref:Uncharacterized protein n=1 Tax=Anguilla anguilla TaxID=7936 RepID=A0A0E9X0L0_ANGAN